MSYLPPVQSARFLLSRVIDIERLCKLPAYTHVDADLIATVLQEGGRFAAATLSPLNRIGDQVGCRLEAGAVKTAPGFSEAYQRYIEAGWPGLDMPETVGGQNLPLTLQTAFAEMVNGACVAFGMVPLMARAAAHVLLEHASAEMIERFARPLASGVWSATICMTEPHAGSDVGRLRTKAEPDGAERWRLRGEKIFISFGDHDLTHQTLHLVLARTPDAPEGTRGLSLFLVPKRIVGPDGQPGEKNGVSVERLEHKMGFNGSPTCHMRFDDALGFRIGQTGAGLKTLFTMVNYMRLEVANQGVAIAEAATGAALRYAVTRLQGGSAYKPPELITNHVDVRRMLLTMRSETEAMRALVLETAFQLDIARFGETEEIRSEARLLAGLLLPICKTRGAETAFSVANLAVQVMGGHGYLAEFGVEQYVRDSRVLGIYEGTSGIQALDLVTRKIMGKGGEAFDIAVQRIRADITKAAAGPESVALEACLRRLEHCVTQLPQRSKRDVEAGASALLDMFGIVAAGWMWLRMLRVSEDDDRGMMIRACARWWAEQSAPLAAAFEGRIQAGAANFDLLDPVLLSAEPT
jgi:alkylation response protein AidB-like acyl-CoA dehydrogenase